MHFLSPTRQRHSSGFTLIEVLVIAPVVILAITGFVALMITLVGDVLVSRDQNTLAFEAQEATDRIEQDARLSVQFLTTTGTLATPQGSDSNFTGTTAFTNTTNTLILNTIATSDNPANSTKQPIYYANQPNACGAQQSFNRIFLVKVIYFIKDGSLWRRTVVPDFNHNSTVDSNTVCTSDPWQQNSCSPGYSVSTRCQTNDAKLMDNIESLTINYYADPNSSTNLGASAATTATTISATINGKKNTVGREFTTSASVRATKINNLGVE